MSPYVNILHIKSINQLLLPSSFNQMPTVGDEEDEGGGDYTRLLQHEVVLYLLLQNFELDYPISGVVLPVWNPQNPSVGDKVARAIVYFVALIYMFLGMSIIADRFMSSIEVHDTSTLLSAS